MHIPVPSFRATSSFLLDYCTRFYERQFITRENKNKLLLARLDRMFDEYLDSGRLSAGGLPVLAQCAAALNLSAAYFSDLLKFETGKSLEEYFEFRETGYGPAFIVGRHAHTGRSGPFAGGIRTYNVSV